MKNVLTDFSYPNHCGLVKNMVYLKYIFVKMYKNKNKIKDIPMILFLFSLTPLNIVLCFYNNICILMFFFGPLIIK